MFHKNNLGECASYVDQFADIQGYVPEAGDCWSGMEWDAATEWDDDAWQEHVEGAVRATERAEEVISGWQEGSEAD